MSNALLPTCKFIILEANRAEFEELFLSLGGRWAHGDVDISDVAMFLFEDGELSYTDRLTWYLVTPVKELKGGEILDILRAKSTKSVKVKEPKMKTGPLLPACKFVLTKKNREEFDELFFDLGGRWRAGDRKDTMGKSQLFFEDGALLYTDSKSIFYEEDAFEMSDEGVLEILRDKAKKPAPKPAKVETAEDKAGRTMTVDQTIEEGDFVYIPHIGEGLYKPTKDGIRFTVKNRNNFAYSFDKNGKDVIGIKIAFKYSQRNQKLLTELFNKKFLSKNDAEDVRTKLEDLVKNGFNILSVKEGDSIKAFTKDQIDQIVELTSKKPDANILHPITGIEL